MSASNNAVVYQGVSRFFTDWSVCSIHRYVTHRLVYPLRLNCWPNKTGEMYDPERYERSNGMVARDAEIYFPQMMASMRWTKNESVLDYGCGTGSTGAHYILPTVESTDSQMYSVDISQDMIAYAQNTYPSPRVTYAVGNVMSDDFPLKDIQFDKIFSIYALQFIKDFREGLKRLHKLLKPGGQMGIMVITSSPTFFMNERLGKNPKWFEYMKGYQEFVPEWFQDKKDAGEMISKHLKDVGFEIQDLSTPKLDYVFDKFEMMLDFNVSVNSFIKEIPKDLWRDFQDEYREFLNRFTESDEHGGELFRQKYEILYAVARK